MSRDAKIGLVIVFAFVFLFGTILVHRLHSTTADPAKTNGEDAVDTADSGQPSVGGRSVAVRPGEPRPGSDPTTVEAVAEDPVRSRRTNQGHQPAEGPVFVGQTRPSIQPAGSFEAPKELPPSPRNGGFSSGTITVSDPGGFRPATPAAESSGALTDERRRVTNFEEDGPSAIPAEVANSDGTPGRIHEAPTNSRRVNSVDPATETEPDTAGPTDNPAASMPDTGSDPTNLEGGPSRPSEAFTQRDEPDEPDQPRTRIRQTVNDQEPDDQSSRPPQVPGWPGKSQPTIESVPPEEGTSPSERATDITTSPETYDPPPRSTVTPSRTDIALENTGRLPGRAKASAGIENQPSGEKTYVVQDGDSFWTISAKFYSTGKYFRELEEYNADRLQQPVSGTAKKVLRPGTTIVVPDVATLKAKKNRNPPATATPSSPSNPNPSRGAAMSNRPAPPAKTDSSHGSSTYRVREFDTLMSISQEKLGTAKRWKEILQLNSDKLSNERQLRPGMELRLPPFGAGEKTTERPVAGR